MISKQAAMLASLYYFPLALLLVLVGTKLVMKCKAVYKARLVIKLLNVSFSYKLF